jgi:predicted amidohydrolase YtcJ
LTVALLVSAPLAAEHVWYNVNGYTPTDDGIERFSVLVADDDGRVIAIGAGDLADDYPQATRYDGGGRTVLPGLTDAHAHIYAQGQVLREVDLMGSNSLADALERIRTFANEHPRAKWVTGRGWNQVLWDGQAFPTAADIDSVVEDRPVYLRRIDGHASWANSMALEIAGIDRDTPDPVGGKILRDSNGDATGVLIDKAMGLVSRHVPEPDADEIRQTYRDANAELLTYGLTSIHDAGISLQHAEILMSMADDGELDIRIAAMLAGAGENLDGFGDPLTEYGNDHLDIAMVKLFSDGALGSRGAAMIEPYTDDAENRGLPFWTQNELNAMVAKANTRGFQVGVHAIGDYGNRMVIDAFDYSQGGKPSPLRNRIEHTQIVSLDDIPRIAELGLIASMQPVHATSDMNMAEDRIGPERIKGGYAWRRMLERSRDRDLQWLRLPGRAAESFPWPVRRRNPAEPRRHAGRRLVSRPGAHSRRSADLVYAGRRLWRAPGRTPRLSGSRQVGRLHRHRSRLLRRSRQRDRRHRRFWRRGLRARRSTRARTSMIVEQVWTGNSYRNFNYLVACPDTGEALAIDPLDFKRCLAVAKDRGFTITQVLNTPRAPGSYWRQQGHGQRDRGEPYRPRKRRLPHRQRGSRCRRRRCDSRRQDR